jgi:5-methylcytosine-specific restriction endonuclease McrA
VKTCRKCLKEYELSNFYKAARNTGGLSHMCKQCDSARAAARYVDKRDEILEKNYAWAKRNPDKILEYKRKYTAENPQKFADRVRSWQQRNPEKVRAISHRKRARKNANAVYEILPKHLARLYTSPCIYCGATENITADHVVPVSRGGSHGIGNLVPACGRCNSSKKDKFLTEWRRISLLAR